MKIHQFESYEKYLETERRGSRYRPNRRANAAEDEIGRIASYYISCTDRPAMHILCHGARDGTEVRLFRSRVPMDAVIVGTDVHAVGQDVTAWDYNQQNPEWIGKFDLIYTNSLDHSPDPLATLKVWVEQLKPTGLLFVVWTFAHMLEERPLPFPGGDCFGAALHEYIHLMRQVGTVRDLLWHHEVPLDKVILVTGKGERP